MIFGISIYKDTDYQTICEVLDRYEIDEMTYITNPQLRRYATEKDIPVQEFKIEWNALVGVDPSFIVDGRYNKNAPREAAQKVANYADKIIIVGDGDRNVVDHAKSTGKEIVNQANEKPKQYKF
jgi:hypothetical protein